MLFSSSLLVFLLSTFAVAAPVSTPNVNNLLVRTDDPPEVLEQLPLRKAVPNWDLSGLTFQRNEQVSEYYQQPVNCAHKCLTVPPEKRAQKRSNHLHVRERQVH